MKNNYPFTDTSILNYSYNQTTYGPDYIRENYERPGFALRITSKNTKTFVYIYNINGKRRYLDLGQYPHVSLKVATEKYSEAFLLRKSGIDPSEYYRELREREKQAEEDKNNLGTVKDLFDCYYNNLKDNGKVSAQEVKRALYARALSPLGDTTKANKVTTEQIRQILNSVFNEGKLVTTNRLRSYLLSAFQCGMDYDNAIERNRCVKPFKIKSNPVKDIKKLKQKEKPCTRNLKKKELRKLWKSFDNIDVSPQYINFVKLLILTSGQRVKEVLHLRWSEIHLKKNLWILPSERSKNGREHYIALTKPSVKLLNEIKEYNENELKIISDFVFPSPMRKCCANKPIRIDSLTKPIDLMFKHANLLKFTPRDLRRTVTTLMGETGISSESKNRIQNHARSDVAAKHYDYYKYKKQDKKAAKKWIKFLKNKVKLDI